MTQFELILALCCLAEGILILLQAIGNRGLKQEIQEYRYDGILYKAHNDLLIMTIGKLQSELSHFPKRGKKGKFEGRGKAISKNDTRPVVIASPFQIDGHPTTEEVNEHSKNTVTTTARYIVDDENKWANDGKHPRRSLGRGRK